MVYVAWLLLTVPLAACAWEAEVVAQACAQGHCPPGEKEEEEEAVGLLQSRSKVVPDTPPKRDIYGCTCGLNSPSPNSNCCSGHFNAEGHNCLSDQLSVTCSSSMGASQCCRDGRHGWCCPEGTACLEQKSGRFNPKACTEIQNQTVGSVHSGWSIAGGGPGAPENLKIHFVAGVTEAATRTQTKDIKNAIMAEFKFGGFTLSNTFTTEWKDVVETSISSTVSQACDVQCPKDYYLWVFRTSIQGIDSLPASYTNLFASCGAVVCSPYGLEHPPACPFGYQDDQEDGFPCCTSLEWMGDEADRKGRTAPPICRKGPR